MPNLHIDEIDAARRTKMLPSALRQKQEAMRLSYYGEGRFQRAVNSWPTALMAQAFGSKTWRRVYEWSPLYRTKDYHHYIVFKGRPRRIGASELQKIMALADANLESYRK